MVDIPRRSKDTRALTGVFEKEIESYKEKGYTYLGQDFPRNFKWQKSDNEWVESSWGRFEKPLGIGNFGAVYAMRLHPNHPLRKIVLDGTVAVKVMKEGSDVDRFRREGIIGEKLCKEPEGMPSSLPKYFGHDTASTGFTYLMMEYLPNQVTLDNYVINNPDNDAKNEIKRLPVPLVISIAKQLVSAVHYAHQRGITNRDINPRNVLMNEVDYKSDKDLESQVRDALEVNLCDVKLIDWGLGTCPDEPGDFYGLNKSSGRSVSVEAKLLGTTWYMSPEAASYSASDYPKECDIYSLGATIYALATGRPPHQGTPEQVLGKVQLGERILHPKKLVKEIPWWFNDFVMKLLLYKINERIQPEDLQAQFERHSLEAL